MCRRYNNRFICVVVVPNVVFFGITVRFRTTSGLDSAVDPVQMKNVTFEHVKGVEEAKNELQDVVEFLKNPQKFTVLGGKLPKGILLVGPPGTGKTLLARAVAGEADVPFYYASGSEFDEMFVGVGASRIRNLFSTSGRCVSCTWHSILCVNAFLFVACRRGKSQCPLRHLH